MSGQTQPGTALQALAEKLRTDAIAIFGEGQAERDIIEWFYAAMLAQPAQHGEAVDVVGYMDTSDRLWADTTRPELMFPLMTVAQHQRILAAAVPAGRKVVPVELLERAVYNMELAEMDGPTYRELRALLTSAGQEVGK